MAIEKTNQDSPPANEVGYGDFRYLAVEGWAQIPPDMGFVEAIGVSVDEYDRVYVFNRGEPAVFVLHSNGQFIEAWGHGCFARPHGICAATNGTLFVTDDLGHRVAQYSVHGEFLRNFGPSEIPSPTGVEGFDYRKIAASAGPFNLPTNVVVAPDGSVLVADGYGNARIHEFDFQGALIRSWGDPGTGPGQFHVPHGIALDSQGRVLVADRENSRIQLFDRRGEFIEVWDDVVRPCQIFTRGDGNIFVAELGNLNGRFPWQPLPAQPIGGRVSIFDEQGQLLSRWGGGLDSRRIDQFYACHDLCVDSAGNVYVAEVALTAAKAAGENSQGLPTLKKFTRLGR